MNNTMEITHEEWKKWIVFEGNHKGYDVVIKFYDEFYSGYVKIPQNHKYCGSDYHDIHIKVHGGLFFSQKIEDDYWIGWHYGHYGDEHRDYKLIDIMMDCCSVISQLIKKERGTNKIITGESELSKQISEHIDNIIAKRPNMGMETDRVNKCLFCGKPVRSVERSTQLATLKKLKIKGDNEVDGISLSDPKKAIKLLNKLNKYEKEINRIESWDANTYICDKCNEGLLKKDIMELLKLFKDHQLMANLIRSSIISYPRTWNIECTACKENDSISEYSNKYHDDNYDIVNETVNKLLDNINDKIAYEYYQAKLWFILKCYDKALVSFQNLLDKHKQIENNKYRTFYEQGFITKNELNKCQRFIGRIISSIPGEIKKIKEILGID